MVGSVLKQMGITSPHSAIVRCDINDASKLLIKGEHMVPAPHEEIMKLSRSEIQFFSLVHGIYSIPSVELIEYIDALIPNKDKCIEVGSGNGVYARSLGILGTDNYMQHPKNRHKFKNCIAAYEMAGQPLVQYGDDVEEHDAKEAVRLYKPETVVMAWVTHRWNPMKPELQGNMFGVDFEWIWKRPHVKQIILVGNESIHQLNPFMKVPHETIDLPFIHSRASAPKLDRLYVWKK